MSSVKTSKAAGTQLGKIYSESKMAYEAFDALAFGSTGKRS